MNAIPASIRKAICVGLILATSLTVALALVSYEGNSTDLPAGSQVASVSK